MKTFRDAVREQDFVITASAMHHPVEKLGPLAAAALEDKGLDRSMADRVVAIVGGVMGSKIWHRARAATKCLTEVPIQILEPARGNTPPTIVRGVIDLVFKENDHWVIVDYKTDDTTKRPLADLAEHYAPQVQAYAASWSRLTGEPVGEAGLFFAYKGHYQRINLAPSPTAGGEQMQMFTHSE